jgi:hypothetical protein
MPLAAGVAETPVAPVNKAPAANNAAQAKDLSFIRVMSLPFEFAPR